MPIYLLFIFLCITVCRTENEIDIKDAGVGFINEDDIAMIFYVTVENKCDKDYEISVCMIQCCENTKPEENLCGFMYLVGGYMGALNSKCTKNVTLIYPNLYLFNRQGVCTVAIMYQNENAPQKMTTEIEFKTTNCEDQPQCPTTDLDASLNCSPVDCVIKYSGGKSYFNPKCKECECVPMCATHSDTCEPEIAYSIATNNCTNIRDNMNMADLSLLEKNEVDTSECEPTLPMNIVCHHGNLDTHGRCVCQKDWTTTTDDEMYEPSLLLYHMCNIETGAWSCVNKGRIRTTALLIAIFALTIATKILLLMCILNWFYRHIRSRKSKICADRLLDSDDERFIICDDLYDLEKCACKHPAPQKSTALRTETVNVMHYGCSPSTFSSVRASTTTERSKRPIKSDQSIVLSHTLSSSLPGSSESESDELTDTDEDYDIEFSGEEEEEEGEEVEKNIVYTPEEKWICSEVKRRGEEEVGEGDEQSEYSMSGADGSRGATTSSRSKSTSSKSKTSTKSDK